MQRLIARLRLIAGLAKKLPGVAREALSLRDVLCFGGIACVGYGLSLVYVPAAWCVVGAALFWLAVIRRPDGAA